MTKDLNSATALELLDALGKKLDAPYPNMAAYVFDILMPQETFDPNSMAHQRLASLSMDLLDLELMRHCYSPNGRLPVSVDEAIDWISDSLEEAREEVGMTVLKRIQASHILRRVQESHSLSRAEAQEWLSSTPIIGFNGKTGQDMIDAGDGDAVITYLDMVEAGVHA